MSDKTPMEPEVKIVTAAIVGGIAVVTVGTLLCWNKYLGSLLTLAGENLDAITNPILDAIANIPTPPTV